MAQAHPGRTAGAAGAGARADRRPRRTRCWTPSAGSTPSTTSKLGRADADHERLTARHAVVRPVAGSGWTWVGCWPAARRGARQADDHQHAVPGVGRGGAVLAEPVPVRPSTDGAQRTPSPTLQAVLFLDEADQYLPATSKPPTKGPLESLLKRGRSAGLGVMLATQSPGDLDYKGRDNLRAWLVGRVQERGGHRQAEAAVRRVAGRRGVEAAAAGRPASSTCCATGSA